MTPLAAVPAIGGAITGEYAASRYRRSKRRTLGRDLAFAGRIMCWSGLAVILILMVLGVAFFLSTPGFPG